VPPLAAGGSGRRRAPALDYLGAEVEPAVLQDFHTRMVLFAGGWKPGRLLAHAG
jgi:hypothetical protein